MGGSGCLSRWQDTYKYRTCPYLPPQFDPKNVSQLVTMFKSFVHLTLGLTLLNSYGFAQFSRGCNEVRFVFLVFNANTLCVLTCSKDNCLRAIFGTRPTNSIRPGPTPRREDCSSFQSITVIPAATTTTVNFTPGGQVNKRQDPGPTTIRPNNIPPYASCGSSSAVRSSRYSSACSCGGITQTTVEAPTPVSTVQCPSASPTVCNGACRGDFSSDKFNCGACGNKCATGLSCMDGQCYQPNACARDNFCSGSRGDCYCYDTTEGRGYCATNGGSCGRFCRNSDDCPNTSVCLSDCGACSTDQFLNSCPSGSNAKMLFMRGAMRAEKRGSKLPYHDAGSDSE